MINFGESRVKDKIMSEDKWQMQKLTEIELKIRNKINYCQENLDFEDEARK